MRQIQVWRAPDGYRWRFLSLVGQEVAASTKPFDTEDGAVRAAYNFRHAVQSASVKNEAGESMPGPLVVDPQDELACVEKVGDVGSESY